ncbi:hypothetical protein CNY73_15525 [Listeria monocytogenes]|nr:hypothetical protein [Listeria monocytogenes]
MNYLNNYQEVIFQAPVSNREKQTSFYQAMAAIGHTKKEKEANFYVFSLRLPHKASERMLMLQSLCRFLRIKEYQLFQKPQRKGNQDEHGESKTKMSIRIKKQNTRFLE